MLDRLRRGHDRSVPERPGATLDRGHRRSRPRSARPVRALVRGSCGGGRHAFPSRWRSRRRRADGRAFRADGAAQGLRRARLRLLHEPRRAARPRSSRRTHGPRCSATGSSRAARCASRVRSSRSRTRSRSRTSAAARGAAGSAPGPRRSHSRSRAAPSSSGESPRSNALRRGGRDAAAAVLGRISPRRRPRSSSGRAARPPARPPSLRARGRHLAPGAALGLKGLSRLGEGESSGVGFLEGDQAAGELEEGEVVLVFLRPADQDARGCG